MHPSPEVLALLALGESGAASADERAHIESCSECFVELGELRHLTAVGRSVDGAELLVPAPHVWDRVLADVHALKAEPGPPGDNLDHQRPAGASVTPLPAGPDRHRAATAGPQSGRRRALVLTAVAAALALIVGVSVGFGIGRGTSPQDEVLARGELSAQPGWTGASGTARLVRDAEGKRMLLVSISTDQPLTGTQAVWLFDPNAPSQMRMLGYLDPTTGQWPVPESIDVSRFSQVDVSEEPPNDASAGHSGNSIVRGPLTP